MVRTGIENVFYVHFTFKLLLKDFVLRFRDPIIDKYLFSWSIARYDVF